MSPRSSWRFRTRLAVFAACFVGLLIALVMLASPPRSSAMARACQAADELKICADVLDFALYGDGIHFFADGNVTIAVGNEAPLLSLTAPAGKLARFVFDPDQPAMFGEVRFISDTNSLPLLATTYKPTGGVFEMLEVDTVNKTISNIVSIFDPPSTIRNSTLLLNFLDRSGVRSFYKTTAPTETENLNFTFDLAQKEFRANVPIILDINNDDENRGLAIAVNIKFSRLGSLSGSVADFGMVIAGLNVAVKNIVLTAGKFQASSVEVSKVTNPNMPNLDPSRPDLIFALQNLKYENKTFSIGGATVPLPNWKFGDNFRMINQTLSIGHDNTLKTSTITISSTLVFGDVFSQSGATPVRIFLKISAVKVGTTYKPVFSAGLSDTTVSLGPLNFKLRGLSFTGDTVQNFYGLQATAVDLLWPANLGGASAVGITGFKFGIDKDGKLKFALGGATISSPPIESGVLKGSSITGKFGVVQNTVSMTLTGNLQVKIPGNSGVGAGLSMVLRGGPNVSPTGSTNCTAPPCLKRFQASLTNFTAKIAGFSLALQNPRFLDDGGFAADSVTLSMSQLLGNLSLNVTGLSVSGIGNVSVTGGGIELPPVQIAGTSFVGFKGSFSKDGSGYKFSGGATLTMPGFDPSGTAKISVSATVATLPTGAFNELEIVVSFSANPGIPIAGTGTELSSMSGSFAIKAGTVTIGVGIKVNSLAKVLSLPIVTATGNATLQVNPFKFSLSASLKVLIFQVASASIEVGHQAGFNGGKGLHASFEFDAVILHGDLSLRVGKVTVATCSPPSNPNNCTTSERLRFAGSASLTVGLERGQFGTALPPKDITFAGVSFQMGEFTKPGGGTTVGMLGTVSCCFDLFNASIFVDLNKPVGLTTGFVKLVNPDNYDLIDSLQIARRIADGVPGYSQRMVARQGLGDNGTLMVPEVTVPIAITKTATAYFGIHYTGSPATPPTLRLQLPNSTELTEGTVNNTSQTFVREISTVITKGNDLAFMLSAAPTGTYSLIIDNPPADYEVVSYLLNNPPALSGVSATCGGAATLGVTVTCNGASSGSQVMIDWTASDTDSPAAKVSVVYASVITPTNQADLGNTTVLSDNVGLGGGQIVWHLNEVPSGLYKVAVMVDDGQHAPTINVLNTLISVTDARAPEVPINLQAAPQPGQLLVKWTPNDERDLAGYEIGFGVVNNPAQFLYSRNMGSKELIFTATNQLDAKLWGLKDNQAVFYGIRAYDLSGNYSAWSPLVSGTPWPLSPHAWTPTPGGVGMGSTQVEAAFETPLNEATLGNGLQVRNASNQPVAGTVTYLYNLDQTEIIGFSFKPTAPLVDGATYNVTLKGGAGGIAAEDGRTMPADFSWTFTVENLQTFLPLVRK